MKRIIALLLAALFACAALTGCSSKDADKGGKDVKASAQEAVAGKQEKKSEPDHVHQWTKGDCTKPEYCIFCGETRGETGDHVWQEATCTSPKTCKVCGKTEGEVGGHSWTFATLEAPKTCTVCGATEGRKVLLERVEHVWEDFKKIKGMRIWDFGVTPEQEPVLVYLVNDAKKGLYTITTTDLSGNQIATTSISAGRERSCSIDTHYVMLAEKTSSEYTVRFYDMDCNLVHTHQVKSYKQPYFEELNGGKVLRIYSSKNGQTSVCLDTETWREVQEPAKGNNGPEYDKYMFASCSESSHEGYRFVCTQADSQWGFTDENGNVLALYADVSDFNIYGYALARNDAENYFVIDTDFNVVGETGIKAVACSSYNDGTLLYARDANDNYELYVVK